MHRKILVATLCMLSLTALGACGKSSTKATAAGYGTPGDATKANRTITVHILPSLKYDPPTVSVKTGETVVFHVSNDTTGIHEFVLGDSTEQDRYSKVMVGMGTMPMTMPSHGNILNIQPGQSKDLAWTFPSAATTVIYASHEPGDYAGGLKGLITIA